MATHPEYVDNNGLDKESDASAVTNGVDELTQDEIKEVRNLAKDETRSINIWRAIVAALILGAGALVSTGTYIYLNRQTIQDSQDAFILFANTIEDVSKIHFSNMFEAARAMARSLTAEAIAQNWSFPFITFPMYEIYAKEARERAGLEVVSYAPIVRGDQADAFNAYTLENPEWIQEGRELAAIVDPILNNRNYSEVFVSPLIMDADGFSPPTPSTGPGPFVPLWEVSPPPISSFLLKMNFRFIPEYDEIFKACNMARDSLFGDMYTDRLRTIVDTFTGPELHQMDHNERHDGKTVSVNQPHGSIVEPIFTSFNKSADIVGYLMGIMAFDAYLVDLLPNGVRGVYVVIENSCNKTFTFQLDGNDNTFLGEGDLSDPAFHSLGRTIDFSENYANYSLVESTPGHCIYKYRVYPSTTFQDDFKSNLPIVFSVAVALIFVLMAATFFVYDMFVQRRNEKVVGAAARSNAIVSSLFPSNVRDRLFAEQEQRSHAAYRPSRYNLKTFLAGDASHQPERNDGNDDDVLVLKTKPIADLFTDTTVMFADICGFTAWSSVREPAQVFTLLEAVYRSFDQIAKRRRVFKVETVGDCYVAVCGLPDPRKDHAVVMARFAVDCINCFDALTKRLEVILGPDTGDLGVRVGMHSGPVTAGVLRGDRARFQLFGDTMNTASRLESSGIRGRIQVSEETANLVKEAGKSHWLTHRGDAVHAKGKGLLSTYWLDLNGDQTETVTWNSGNNYVAMLRSNSSPRHLGGNTILSSGKMSRLVDWNVEVLLRLLRQIVARRNAMKVKSNPALLSIVETQMRQANDGSTVLDEVQEIITLPKFDSKAARRQEDPETINLGQEVTSQLLTYVSSIAAMYHDNPFHNFEHASHVTMSVVKLLSRIIAPSDLKIEGHLDSIASTLHDHTYGITSDPLTQFACVLSALIHDADHPGVPNAQLAKERTPLSQYYHGKSIAEQNSVDLAWALLLDDKFSALRSTIYSTPEEMKRFRQLVVNSVMATDIMDKELKALRNARWDCAFQEDMPLASTSSSSSDQAAMIRDNVNRKATIVIEHLIQASDVAHTMQHWHIYRKWNERFFMECYRAYKDGRAEVDPSLTWYQGEIGFFDYYIIPLANKLKDCGVFGVSSDEYLNYAMKNRQEWEIRGQDVVSEMLLKAEGNTLAVQPPEDQCDSIVIVETM